MADNAWSLSGCGRSDVWYYGIPGSGCWYWTARYGTYWVGSDLGPYGAQGWECGALGAPVKAYEYLTEFGAAGQWFEHGALYYKNGAWHEALGDYGQTAGRITADPGDWPADAELPPGHADKVPTEPNITAEMSHR